jgi:hypothetical protein
MRCVVGARLPVTVSGKRSRQADLNITVLCKRSMIAAVAFGQ